MAAGFFALAAFFAGAFLTAFLAAFFAGAFFATLPAVFLAAFFAGAFFAGAFFAGAFFAAFFFAAILVSLVPTFEGGWLPSNIDDWIDQSIKISKVDLNYMRLDRLARRHRGVSIRDRAQGRFGAVSWAAGPAGPDAAPTERRSRVKNYLFPPACITRGAGRIGLPTRSRRPGENDSMRFACSTDDITLIKTDILGLLCFEDRPAEGTLYEAIDRALDGLLTRAATDERFKGRRGQSVTVHSGGRIGATRVMLAGAGLRRDFQPSEVRGFAARVVRAAGSASARSATVALPYSEGTVVERASQFLAEGAVLGEYRFDKYLSDEKKAGRERLEELRVALAPASPSHPPDPGQAALVDPAVVEAVRRGMARGESVAAGVSLARDLVNEPAAEMTPSQMAEVARRVAKEHGLEVKVLGPKECEKLGMGMFLAVARGSEEEPRLIHLIYRPPSSASKGKTPPSGAGRKRVALIGKGVTFDSGGLSLKPNDSMQTMKTDMAGAAAVIAAIGVLSELGAPCEVHAIAACTENMPSGRSYKLGDVLRSMAGKTVEINNTDAEGRLVLGDAMTYALREARPDEMFDFATLTGACIVALGPHIAGVMGSDQSLVERWLAAARFAGEEMWPLPLPERLKEQLKSEVADMRNTGERYGGALTAGLFLREFAGDAPWVHVDLAGPSNTDKEFGHVGKGATGFGVSTIVEYLAGRD